MVNLFDIMKQAQSGAGFTNLSRQYGLSVEDTQRAVEALLPAFTLALRHTAQNPFAFAQFLEMMNSARHAPFFDGGLAGMMGGGRPGGSDVIATLFGSDDVSRRVAEQASGMTGIATGVLHQMLPTVAAMIMGGLFRSASVEGLSDLLRTWSDWLRNIKAPAAGRAADPGAPYKAWSDFMGAMMGAPNARVPEAPRRDAAADPWSGMLQAMFGGAQPAPPPPPPATPNPFEALSRMFETGREVQAQHLAGLQATFADVWGQEVPAKTAAR